MRPVQIAIDREDGLIGIKASKNNIPKEDNISPFSRYFEELYTQTYKVYPKYDMYYKNIFDKPSGMSYI